MIVQNLYKNNLEKTFFNWKIIFSYVPYYDMVDWIKWLYYKIILYKKTDIYTTTRIKSSDYILFKASKRNTKKLYKDFLVKFNLI